MKVEIKECRNPIYKIIFNYQIAIGQKNYYGSVLNIDLIFSKGKFSEIVFNDSDYTYKNLNDSERIYLDYHIYQIIEKKEKELQEGKK